MILRELSERVAVIGFDDLPDEAVATAKLAILDTVGVTIAGAFAEPAVIARRALLPPTSAGPASVFGTGGTASALDAAVANGTAAHALDFDDCSNSLGGHPTAPILPALWALAEETGASGRDLLAAYAVGVEVETRIARAVNFHHYDKGWHPTATLGTFGAAAACARLIELDPPRFANALAIAASSAAGLKANFGSMTKPFHVGQCSRNGLTAALLAREGLSANPAVLEHPQGFFEVFNGKGTYRPERVLEGLGAPFDLIEPGIAFKRHPCCASTHPAIDALLQIRSAHGLSADDIAHVRSWTHPRRLRHTNRPDPRTGLDGKFSVQYALARAALHGEVRIEHFSDDAVLDPAARAVMARITAEPHPAAVMETDEHFFAEITLATRDGRTLSAHVDRPLGRDRAHPLPPGSLAAKFRDCAGIGLFERAVAAVEAAVGSLDAQTDIRAIGVAMRAGLKPDVPLLAAAAD